MLKHLDVRAYWSEEKRKVLFILLDTYSFKLSNNDVIIIPSGYRTDFATVPWWARWLIPPIYKHKIAALVHDYLYELSYKVGNDPEKNRLFADREFLRLMIQYNVPYWMRTLMYFAVRIGGKKWWKKVSNP